MENHTFSDPVPVADAAIPTWQVDVLRPGVADSVGTLKISNDNFPPRKRKNKVVWKLPDDMDSIPKFGEHEKKRLWELFKQQKKERRRKSKLKDPNEEGGTKEEEQEPQGSSPPLATITADSTPAESEEEQLQPQDRLADTDGGKSAGTALPPPPPGFDFASLSLDDSTKQIPNSSPLTQQSSSAPPPGLPPLSIPPRFFLHSPTQPPATLAATVASTFIASLTSGNILDWLGYYSVDAQQVLCMGSAHAVCQSMQDRFHQWQRLSKTVWECQGYTLQTVDETGILVNMTGRTMQQEECLAYNMTLILRPTNTASSGLEYQIANEVLSLFAVTTTPVATVT